MDSLDQVFGACDIEHVVLLTTSEENFWPVHWILSHPLLSGMRMAHFNVDYMTMTNTSISHLINVLWDFYYIQQVRNFIIVTKHYKVIMDSAHQLFNERQTAEGALFPHKTTFIIVWPSTDSEVNLPKMDDAVMDNVAIVMVDVATNKVAQIFTLMYREQRRREWEAVYFFKTFSNTISLYCTTFPNRMYGLNGRNLTIMAKEWLSHLRMQTNRKTGQIEYTGYYVDIINALSSSINFTFHFTPRPNEENTINWSDFSGRVGLGEVDFGATTYLGSSALYLNHSVSFPILWVNISGVYVNNERSPVISPLKLFKLEVYLCLLSSILFTMSLYLIITNISKKILFENINCFKKPNDGQNPSSVTHEAPTKANADIGLKRQCLDKMSSIKHIHSNLAMGQENRSPKTQDFWTTDHDNKSSDFKDNNVVFQHLDFITDSTDHLKKTCQYQFYEKQIFQHQYKDDVNSQRPMQYRSIGTQTTNEETSQNISTSFQLLRQLKYSYSKTSEGNEQEAIKKNEKMIEIQLTRSRLPKTSEQVRCFHGISLAKRLPNEDVIHLFFKFLGSIFSQDSLPEPRNCSARLLMWSWCLMLLVINAVFTGNITANLVDQEESIPFSTFEQLLQRNDYKWGLSEDSSFFNIMKNSRPGTTLRRLYDSMEQFARSDPSVTGSFEVQVMKVKSEKYVTFFFSGDLEYLYEQNNVSNLVIMEDNFMTTYMGFIFPRNSTLNDLISERLLLMSDVGILPHLLQANTNVSTNSKVSQSKDSSNMALDLFYMQGLFYSCGYGLAMATVVLLLEFLYSKFLAKYLL
ncbi:glutamate receptor U1-like isoform X1 [Biomphalaria pfeifferi]|uniref:Glutamate receptor U1-like isoform X1 n=1 Tax=Biomphalaria pfeifferi TaxID=112525 RepID=A0AAD8BWL9_BIOPF|nr:glutamate receptor U1-like isoform X1 [Biomphalaria pfeifferi]